MSNHLAVAQVFIFEQNKIKIYVLNYNMAIKIRIHRWPNLLEKTFKNHCFAPNGNLLRFRCTIFIIVKSFTPVLKGRSWSRVIDMM